MYYINIFFELLFIFDFILTRLSIKSFYRLSLEKMPPKKAAPKKLHELAPEVRVGFKIDDISKKTYIVGKQFATGGFGRIHTCTEEGKSHQMVMKIEPSTNGPLLTEVVVFNRILKKEMIEAYKKTKKIPWIGLPYIIANGYFTYNGDKMRYMVIPIYATSLEATRESNGGTLSVKDSLTVANCVLGALEYLHDSVSGILNLSYETILSFAGLRSCRRESCQYSFGERRSLLNLCSCRFWFGSSDDK